MSETESEILQRELIELKMRVTRLETEKSAADAAIEFERLPPNAKVGVDYIAYRFGWSTRKAGRRKNLPSFLIGKEANLKPLRFEKRDVDAAWREYTKPVREKAAEVRAKAARRHRRSIITKKAA